MTQNTTVGSFVVGKVAEVTFRVADLYDVPKAQEALAAAQSGLTVGITVRPPHNKKENIAEVEAFVAAFNDKLRAVVETAPAPEVTVAPSSTQTQNKGEVKTMTNNTTARVEELKGEIRLVNAQFDQKQIDKETKEDRIATLMAEINKLTQKSVLATARIEDFSKDQKNAAYKGIKEGIEYQKDLIVASLPKFEVTVLSINAFPKPDRNGRIGEIIFHVPAGMMEVKKWNNATRKFEWVPVEDCKYNAFDRRFDRIQLVDKDAGEQGGFIRLAIKENAKKEAFISWPREQDKNNEKIWYDVFRAANPAFGFMHSDNNENVRAALTAFVLTFWGEFKQTNPLNRTGFNEHCGNCRHMKYMEIYDGTSEDFENKANAIDTSELGQWGAKMPQWICTVNNELVDADAIEELNESQSYEGRQYFDEEGQLRFARPDEAIIAGKPVKVYKLRAEGTKEKCATCPFYAKNERKAEDKFNAEVEQAVSAHKANGGQILRDGQGKLDMKGMGLFVQRYWTERAQANAQPVFTKHGGKWSLGFPGEFENVEEFFVQGVGGINVVGGQEVVTMINKASVAKIEPFNEELSKVAKLVDIIHTTCNRFNNITEETLGAVVNMIQTTEVPASGLMKSRYDRAIQRLAGLIQSNQ